MVRFVLLLLILLPIVANSEAPNLTLFKSQMLEFGRKHCEVLKDDNALFDQVLANTYYDAEWVFYQIADYTNDPYWLECAQRAELVYRDGYTFPNDGKLPGYWLFTHGLLIDALRTGDFRSIEALRLIATNGSYAPPTTPLEWTADSTMSREVAYNIMTALNAEKLGKPLERRYYEWIDQAFGHLDQWFVLKNAPYVRPFMVSLTAHALIMNEEKSHDERTVPAIKRACDELWKLWISTAGSFQYTDRATSTGGTEPAPDLNLLIAPIYAWIYFKVGDATYRDKADIIFNEGVKRAYLVNAKQFNQNYRLSFSYLKWRESPNRPSSPKKLRAILTKE